MKSPWKGTFGYLKRRHEMKHGKIWAIGISVGIITGMCFTMLLKTPTDEFRTITRFSLDPKALNGATIINATFGTELSTSIQHTHVGEYEIVQCDVCGKYLHKEDSKQWEVINSPCDIIYQTLCHSCRTSAWYDHHFRPNKQ